jgi:hypothetical protein
MKTSPKKSLQEKLQDKEYFLNESALIAPIGSHPVNFKTGCCFVDVIEGKVLKLPEDFKSAVTLFVQDKQILIEVQNKRLIHPSYIVLGSLRSYARNVMLRPPTFTDKNSDSEEFVFKSYLKEVSISFLHALEHLNDVLRIYLAKRGREELASSFTVKF